MSDAESLVEKIVGMLEHHRNLVVETARQSNEHVRPGLVGTAQGMTDAIRIVRGAAEQWKEDRKDAEHVWCHQSGPPCPRCGMTHMHHHTGKANDPKMGGAP